MKQNICRFDSDRKLRTEEGIAALPCMDAEIHQYLPVIVIGTLNVVGGKLKPNM